VDGFFEFFFSYFVLIVIVNALLAFIPAYIAVQKGRSFGALWLVSFFGTIVIGLLVVIALPAGDRNVFRPGESRKRPLLSMPEYFTCPKCAENVKSAAEICRYCKFDLTAHKSSLEDQIRTNVEEWNLHVRSPEYLDAQKKQTRRTMLIAVAPVAVVFIASSIPAITEFIETNSQATVEPVSADKLSEEWRKIATGCGIEYSVDGFRKDLTFNVVVDGEDTILIIGKFGQRITPELVEAVDCALLGVGIKTIGQSTIVNNLENGFVDFGVDPSFHVGFYRENGDDSIAVTIGNFPTD
jgi:hypothetical protein